MKRSCQRHTQVFDLPVRRMISLVPTPSALKRTISARQTCLCGVLRSRASAFRRRRSAGLRVMEIPVRMRQTRMHSGPWESPPGFKCQTRSTRLAPRHVRIRHRRDETPAEYRSFFGCDVEFGADSDEIVFPGWVASLPIVGRDNYLNDLLRRYAEAALADRPQGR